MGSKLKVLFVSAEVAPFAKVGGLADVAGSLPKALSALGHDVRVLMPAYGLLPADKALGVRSLGEPWRVSLNPKLGFDARLWQFSYLGLNVWALGGGHLFDGVLSSEEIYSPGRDAYLFLAKAAIEACQNQGWIPDVIHCHDWHTGFLPVLLEELADSRWDFTAACMTIHNLAYQGEFGRDTLDAVGLPQCLFDKDRLETYGAVNFLKAGCAYSQQINTVSETYAREIETPEFGCRLEGLIAYLRRQGRMRGILNGIDTEFFNPATDPHIEASYTADDQSGKASCKLDLLQTVGLPSLPGTPLIGMVTRLSSQKGFDLLMQAAERILALPTQLIVQGLGDPWAAEQLRALEAKHPGRVSFQQVFDPRLAQKVYAATDMFLMPSAYEPCGLGQMIAMRYGSVPVVRATGGLADTVQEGETGFVFSERSGEALLSTIERACSAFHDPKVWFKIVKNGMTTDFSWTRSAKAYERMYIDAVAAKRAKSISADEVHT